MYVCRPLHVDGIKLNVHIWKSISDYSRIHGNHIKSLSWHNGILFFACHCFLVFNHPHNNIAYTMIVCLTTECYKWIVVFEMVTFIVKISICMANWYSRYLRLFGKRDRESLALSKVCEMCLCFFPLCGSSSAGFVLNIGKESNYGHTSSGICRQHFEIQFQTYVT